MCHLRTLWLGALLAWALAEPVHAAEGDSHLRAGAAHFRAGRFQEAVVEFKVARERGAGNGCSWYIAAALTRAGRFVEALEAFEEAEESSPGLADALFLYYRGVACSETQLVACAADSFDRASRASGPKVSEQARQLAAEAAALLSAEPPREAIDVLLARAQRVCATRLRLGRVFRREALALSERRADQWRRAESLAPCGGLDGGATLP